MHGCYATLGVLLKDDGCNLHFIMFLRVLGALWIYHLEFAGLDGGLVFSTIYL